MENIEPQASLAGTKACPSSRVVLVVYFFDCCRVGCNPQRGVCCSHFVSLILQVITAVVSWVVRSIEYCGEPWRRA